MNSQAYSSSQELAIREDSPCITLIAGPGSGKTRTLTARVARLLRENSADPTRIAVMTFTIAAANEFRERLAGLGIEPAVIDRFRHLGTLHGFARKIIRESGMEFRTLPDDELTDIIRAAQTRFRTDFPRTKVLNALARPSYQPGNLGMLAKSIRKEMRARRALSYDVQLSEARRLLSEGYLPSGVRHLFVDEFQDSASDDALIYEAIRADSVFYVGDPDQSIFGFRGSSPDYLIEIARRATRITLEENYRCASSICELADRIIAPAQPFPKRTVSMNGQPGRVGISTYETEEEELLKIAEWAYTSPESCAVLCRYNRTVERVADVLRGKGLPVSTPADPEPDRAFDEALAGLESGFLPESADPVLQGGLDDVLAGGKAPEVVVQFLSRFTDDIGKIQRVRDAMEDGTRAEDLADLFASTVLTGQGVSVMSIHAAKGREWDHVWIPAANDVAFGTDAEDRRLLFVAVTRARSELMISSAGTSSMPGGTRPSVSGSLALSPLLAAHAGTSATETSAS